MTLPDALALRRRMQAAVDRRDPEQLRGAEYVVRRSAHRSLRVTPFYVAVRR